MAGMVSLSALLPVVPLATVLIDGNNFYASCEALLDPAVVGRPLVVLSNNDGCIVSRSAEARALGIPMGAPFFQVQRQLERHGVVVRSSNYTLYGDMSQRLMATLEAWVEELEIYSIDEAFGLLHRPRATDGLPADLTAWGLALRQAVRQQLEAKRLQQLKKQQDGLNLLIFGPEDEASCLAKIRKAAQEYAIDTALFLEPLQGMSLTSRGSSLNRWLLPVKMAVLLLGRS
jgi:hypothetical protein